MATKIVLLVFPYVLGDDMGRRGITDFKIFWIVSFIPLLGLLAYLCFRPSLITNQT